jgi:hypothetical protein
MKKPPAGTGTFCPSPMLVFDSPPLLEQWYYTVTKAIQNEAVLGMNKPPVGTGTFCPSPMLVFFSPHARNIFQNGGM